MGKRLTVKAETKLERAVLRWINGRAPDYQNGAAGALADLFYGGCSSGMVGELIYTRDCVNFYKRHRAEIDQMLKEALEETGAGGPGALFTNPNAMQWDASDPLAREDTNQNILAWYGFEEVAHRLADRAGIDAKK